MNGLKAKNKKSFQLQTSPYLLYSVSYCIYNFIYKLFP